MAPARSPDLINGLVGRRTYLRRDFERAMRVVCVPVLADNFAYLLIDEAGITAAIDPAQPDKVSTKL